MNNKYKGIRKLVEKWKVIDKRAVYTTSMVIVLFALSWLVFAYHLNDISTQYSTLISNEVTSQVQNTSEKMSKGIFRTSVYANNLAISLSNQDLLEEHEIKSGIMNVKENVDFIDIFFVTPDIKKFITPDDREIAGDVASYIDMYDGFSAYTMFDNTNHLCTDDDSFVVVAPVKAQNAIIGYIVGVSKYISREATIDDKYDIKGDIVILDESGIVTSLIRDGKVEELNERYAFFDYVSESVSEADFAAITGTYEECIRTKELSTVGAIADDDGIYYLFYPIEGAGRWCIVNCVEEASILSVVRKMLINSVLLFIVIIVLMVFAALTVIRHIRREQQRVQNLEYLDGLTGIMNRNAFTSKAEELLHDNKNLPYYVACIDVLNFRIINETYGHERSDVIIKAFADACKEAFGKNETYGRLTADVFVALVINDGEEAERISFIEGKIREAAKTVYINHPIKVKRGYYDVTNYSEPVSRMIDKANIARKYISADAKDLSCKYTDQIMEGARKTEFIESKMEDALRTGEFKPYLQAKYDMEKHHVCGAEALVRWQRSDGTIVPPGDFIPLFEKNGFVEKVDFYMLEEICKYLRKMIDEGRTVYPVSVNQSRYLLNDPEYVNKVRDILLRYEIPIGLIELELTETVFFHERERMIDMMNELKYIHVNLSIDDFGSGYSSFNLLKDVPFDVLKIDRAFLSDSTQSEKGRWILKEIVEMAHGLGMSVICEGVETTEQSEMLLSIGCTKAQGFLYARPVPLYEFIEKYNEVK